MELWQDLLASSYSTKKAIVSFLELDEEKQAHLLDHPPFAFLLPKRLAEKIPKNTLDDPLARQFLPLKEESKKVSGFLLDPTGEEGSRKCPMLIHKYEKRALLAPSGACAMHCRYCFRQNFSYQTSRDFSLEIEYLEKNTSLSEVILSGGDPLSLPDHRLEKLMKEISKIPHIEIIRFHSRFIIGIPERVTEKFLSILENCPKQITFAIHINHPSELDSDVLKALKAIAKLGIPIISQTVLLKGVNDDFVTLHTLFLTLIAKGIIPYYLHQLDKVDKAHHFEVSEERGKELMEQLTQTLPGYAVPKYVKEISKEPSKTPIIYTHRDSRLGF